MLRRNLESLRDQSDPDWIRTVIWDEEIRGVAWAVGNLANVEAAGDYVWVLDDDDLCTWKGFVETLKQVVDSDAPDVIMVRCYHAKFGFIPPSIDWRKPPELGRVGTSCYVVRREVWNETHDLWQARYDGDFYYIKGLWDRRYRFYWLDQTAAYYPLQSKGAAE